MILNHGILGSKSLVAPSAPVATAATSVTTNGFTANCNSVVGAASYRLDVSTVSNFASFVSGYENLTVAGTSQAVTGLASGTTYYYRWRAVNAAGTSANSNTITQATAASAPATPTGLSVFERSGNRWGATWNSVSGATGYKIRFRVNAGSWATIDVGTFTSYNPSFAYADCDFIEAQVLAYNISGDSAWSFTSSVYVNCFV